MKRDKDERKEDFFVNTVSEPSNPPDELAQNVSKKPLSDELLLLFFFFDSSESDRFFQIFCMIRIRFFGSEESIQRTFRRARQLVH